ncbi:MAG: hypothetical protein LBO76_04120, partial [Treponema sp.]|nr:hypothetical protein [Treponema sp.]
MKKTAVAAAVLAAALAAGSPVWAGGGRQETRQAAQEQARDLKGLKLSTLRWFRGAYDPYTAEEPTDAYELAVLNKRKELMSKHNFTFEEVQPPTADLYESVALSIMSGDPLAEMVIMAAQGFTALSNQNLLFPVSTVPAYKLLMAEPSLRYIKSIEEATTINGKTYGFGP